MQGGAPNTLALRRPVPVTPAMLAPPDRAVTPATSEDGPARCRAGERLGFGQQDFDVLGVSKSPHGSLV